MGKLISITDEFYDLLKAEQARLRREKPGHNWTMENVANEIARLPHTPNCSCYNRPGRPKNSPPEILEQERKKEHWYKVGVIIQKRREHLVPLQIINEKN